MKKIIPLIALLVLSIVACKKTVNTIEPVAEPTVDTPYYYQYMEQMSKPWLLERAYTLNTPTGSSTQQLNDTTIPINIATITSIAFTNDTLVFSYHDTVDQMVVFNMNKQMVTTPYSKTIFYYYILDSFICGATYHIGGGGGKNYHYKSK